MLGLQCQVQSRRVRVEVTHIRLTPADQHLEEMGICIRAHQQRFACDYIYFIVFILYEVPNVVEPIKYVKGELIFGSRKPDRL